MAKVNNTYDTFNENVICPKCKYVLAEQEIYDEDDRLLFTNECCNCSAEFTVQMEMVILYKTEILEE